jgi:hypothetical protein
VVNVVVPTDSAPRGPPSTSSSTMVVDTTKPVGSAPRGLPSTSPSTSVMDATGPAGSAPQGARHRHCLQHRWWTLPDPLTAPPRGSPSTSSSSSVVDAAGGFGSAPKGPAIDVYFNRHRRRATSGSRCQYLLPTPPRGPLVNYHY